MKPSDASSHVKYAIRDVVLEAKKEEAKGKEVLYLNIGDPAKFDFSPPRCIVDGTKNALDERYKSYAPAEGDEELRREIGRVEGCHESQVFVTAGLSEGIDFATRIFMDARDSILLPNPTYPLYVSKTNVIGGEPRFYECGEAWVPDPEDMRKRIDETTRALVIINPNNPTGAVTPLKVLRELGDIAAEHDLPIFTDEVYDHVILDEDAEMHKMKDVVKDIPVFSGNSLSKNFFYPGARTGYVAIHNDSEGKFLDAFTRMCNQRLSVNWEFQRGAIEAYRNGFGFNGPYLEKLRKRRDILCRRINEIPGLSVASPRAAMYGFVKVDGYKGSDWDFVYQLLREEAVLVVPGSAFYKNHPEELYFRTTLLPDENTLELAMEKLDRFMNRIV
ncbi:MAG: aminotransferase class I/II-fold pyridoxal phosphate-dependent enzyme [Candidatus Micrarchaeia archaeon]